MARAGILEKRVKDYSTRDAVFHAGKLCRICSNVDSHWCFSTALHKLLSGTYTENWMKVLKSDRYLKIYEYLWPNLIENKRKYNFRGQEGRSSNIVYLNYRRQSLWVWKESLIRLWAWKKITFMNRTNEVTSNLNQNKMRTYQNNTSMWLRLL